eukprot:gene7936-10769_t
MCMKITQNLVIGLNPALQRIVQFPNGLNVGNVNRASKVDVCLGGKGQNVVVAANCMQVLDKPALLQLLGSGNEGDEVLNILNNNQLISTDFDLSIRTSAPCRTCITLVDLLADDATEVIEPSGHINNDEIKQLMVKINQYYADEKVNGIAIMGSMPPGCHSSLYADIIKTVCNNDSKVLLDTVSGVMEALQTCTSKDIDFRCFFGVVSVKEVDSHQGDVGHKVAGHQINAGELCKLAGLEINNKNSTKASFPVELLYESINKLMKIGDNGSHLKYDKLYIATTDGPFPATLVSMRSNRKWKIILPSLPFSIKNPIGAGDAVASENDIEMLKSFCWGISCGAASCESSLNSIFELSSVIDIYNRIIIEELIN